MNSTVPSAQFDATEPENLLALRERLRTKARELGFQDLGVSDVHLDRAAQQLESWLAAGMHGTMQYMSAHGSKRLKPDELVPGTLRVLSVRMDYLPESMAAAWQQLERSDGAYVSRYALGRDYHKLLRARLQKLAEALAHEVGPLGYRVFVDSGPVLEKPLAQKAGIGWIGKHTNLINKNAGSWFFLGELLIDLPLPIDEPATPHCGSCARCIEVCPTAAIIAPFQLDARRCISYLTIESKAGIPIEFRKAIGNRIYGCDDCQLVCPWNKFAQITAEPDFLARHGLDRATLTDLFAWTEAEFLSRTEGSAIRRIGHIRWLRNIAVALGNAPSSPEVIAALQARIEHSDEMVREHVLWALAQHRKE